MLYINVRIVLYIVYYFKVRITLFTNIIVILGKNIEYYISCYYSVKITLYDNNCLIKTLK